MRTLFALVFLLAGGTTAMWGQHTVSGHITSENGSALPGCHVHAGTVYTVTDAQGFYRLELAASEVTISATFVGYRSAEKKRTISSDTTVDFSLKPDTAVLSEVNVTATPNRNAITPKTTLSTKDAERYSNAALGDLLREVSGVSSLKTGSTVVKPVINGLHSSRVVLVNNDVRMEDQQWGLEHAPNLDVNAAGRVSVIKGASALQYGGDAVGGVILVEPARIPIKDTVYGKAILNSASNGRGGSISSSLTKSYATGWNWTLQGTLKYMGDLETPDYILSNTGIREHNISGSVVYHGEHSGFDAYYSTLR